MKQLYFVRHGLTDMNVTGHFSGQIETPLNDVGRGQAKAAGQYINDKNIAIDLIICSPYQRTYDTAAIIAKEIGYPIDHIQQNNLLSERNFGVLEGTPGQAYFKDHTYEGLDHYENVETIDQVQQRASSAYDYIKTLKADNILVVGHGASGRALRRVAKGQPPSFNYGSTDTQIPNAEVIQLA